MDASGNRFGPVEDDLKFDRISELHLNYTLLDWDDVRQFLGMTFQRDADQFHSRLQP